MSFAVCLQVIDASALSIVRTEHLLEGIMGICVTGQWLVVSSATGQNHTLRVYSLPDVELMDQVWLSSFGHYPRANTAGVVYLPGDGKITMFFISDTGNIAVLGDLTAGGQLQGIPEVAVGPQPGQLCVGQHDPPCLYIINIATDSIIHTLGIPDGVERVWSVAAVANGQILMQAEGGNELYLYRSVSQPAVVQHITWQHGVVMLGYNNQFIIGEYEGLQLSVIDSEGNWHSVDALNDEIYDLAVWGECVLYLTDYIRGGVVLLCPESPMYSK